MSTEETIVLTPEMAKSVREALAIGLASFGIIEELDNSKEMADLLGKPWPQAAWPTHPTGSADAVSKFATALAYLV
jgi:hypothetical protein